MLLTVSADIHLMPDWTFFVQLGIFLLAAAMMYLFIVRPIQKVLDMRKLYTKDADSNAEMLNAESAALERERIEAIEKALRKAHEARESSIASAKERAGEIINEARIEARRIVDDADVSIDSSRRMIVDEMGSQADELAKEIERRILA